MTHRYLLSPLGVETIETEIETGRTFDRIALDSDDPKKTARNTDNARKAYQTAKAWAEKALLSAADSKKMADQLELLKAQLAELEKRLRSMALVQQSKSLVNESQRPVDLSRESKRHKKQHPLKPSRPRT